MDERQTAPEAPRGETCLCRDAMRRFDRMFGLRSETRQHLRNSRIELLKAIRSVIDARIQDLSGAGQQGTKVTVD